VIPDGAGVVLFAAAALALLVVPGPAVLYIVARSLHGGRRAGLASVLGIHVGTLVHITAATAGLSALVVSSAAAFTTVKVAGAVYLVGLGLWTLLSNRSDPEPPLGGQRNLRRAFAQGIVVNVLNPKTALFFLAFLPQFTNPAAGPVAPQLLLLGAITVATAIPCDAMVALGAGGVARAIRRNPTILAWQNRVSGAILVGLGAWVALARRSS
jgi:threonine/homoserine/homoserine lactone efflux protein